MNQPKPSTLSNNQKKLERIDVRVSKAELLLLQQKSTACHLSLSEYLRRCGLGRKLPHPPTHSLKATLPLLVSKLIEELSALNAIARSTNHPDITERATAIAQLLLDISQLSK